MKSCASGPYHATLPGREALTFGIDREGAVIPTRKPNQSYNNNRLLLPLVPLVLRVAAG